MHITPRWYFGFRIWSQPGVALCLPPVLLFLFSPQTLSAETEYIFTPAISVTEQYDDNIDLERNDTTSDYITWVRPSILFGIVSKDTYLDLRYAPSFVKYAKESDNDTIRHLGSLTFNQRLSQHFFFDLSDSLLRSEDPLEDIGDEARVRRTRDKYWKNAGQAGITYQYGPENTLGFGYGNLWLDNDDPTPNDGTVQRGFGGLTHWFSLKDGLTIDYECTRADLSTDEDPPTNNDLTGHSTFHIPHSSFNIQNSSFPQSPSPFSIQHSKFIISPIPFPNHSGISSCGYADFRLIFV